jgi:hypothetical protein
LPPPTWRFARDVAVAVDEVEVSGLAGDTAVLDLLRLTLGRLTGLLARRGPDDEIIGAFQVVHHVLLAIDSDLRNLLSHGLSILPKKWVRGP